MARAADWPERLYLALLYCYPGEFRSEYGDEMRAAFRERRREENASGVAGSALFAISILSDTVLSAAREHANLLMRDLRFALRVLRQTPSFTVSALLALGIGIGSATAVFSLLYAVLLRPLPYFEPNRVVRIWETNHKLGFTRFSASTPNFLSWRERSRAFESLAAIRPADANLALDGEPERVSAARISANFWETLGVRLAAGRSFTAAEDQPGSDAVVMISDRLWRRRYAAAPEVLGKPVFVNGAPRTLIGIVPTHVGFSSTIDVWMPLAPDPAHESRGDHRLGVLARLKPGVSAAQADADLVRIASHLQREYPLTNTGWSVRLEPVMNWIVKADLRTGVWVLMGAAGLLLLAACSSVANLLLARAAARRREIGIRVALGASRYRLLRQLLTETLLLAALGSVLGIGFAAVGVRALAALLPADTPRIEALALSGPVLGFAVALTFLTAALFGLAPAWIAGRQDVNASLKDSGRGAVGPMRGGLRDALVAVQMALATVLVVGAMLLLQSFHQIQGVNAGFDPAQLLTARISLPPSRYTDEEKAAAFYRALLADVRSLPGVIGTGITSNTPLDGGDTVMHVAPFEARPSTQAVPASWRVVTSGYLPTLRVPLLSGRFFADWEPEKASPAVLSEGLARRLWPNGEDPVGRRVAVGDNRQEFTVVGVAGDVNQLSLTGGARFTIYFPPSRFLWDPMTLVVRSPLDPQSLAGAVRRSLRRIDPLQPLYAVRTMREAVDEAAAEPRLHSALLSVFAALALLLGAIGVAGVVAYSVARRTPEIAIRMALGASPGRALRELMRSGLGICAIGVSAGMMLAAGLAHLLATLLFRIEPNDPLTFGATAAALSAAAALACWFPARRVTRIHPAIALRSE